MAMDEVWNKTWYTGNPECNTPTGKTCCSSCASGGPCAGDKKETRACCNNCASGLPCKGTSSVDRHHYDRGCRGVGEYAPTLHGAGSKCDHPDSYYWPMHRPIYRTRAGLPTHRDHPELYDEDFMESGGPGKLGENVLSTSRYRRSYYFEKEPYFFAKEYEDDFCHRHPNPWTENGYYYYKDAHAAQAKE